MLECHASTANLLRPNKKVSKAGLSTITLAYMYTKNDSQNKEDRQRMRVLFDSGCGGTLVNKDFVKNLTKIKDKETKWTTKAGGFKTSEKCKIKFTLPAFYESKIVCCTAYVDESSSKANCYDIIIGRDLLHSLGINLLFSTGEMNWDNAIVKMQPTVLLSIDWIEDLKLEVLYAHDPDTTDAERIQAIISGKYTPADLTKIVTDCSHLSSEEQQELSHLLNKFEPLFDGSLGTWQTAPIELELEEPGTEPYHAKPYPVPHSQEQKLKEEVQRMCEYGVMRKINDSEWAAPMFTITKPDGSLRSLADLRELNKRIKRKPFPLPKITDMLQKLEEFLFATSLDVNMGYYHILLTPESSRLCTVVLPWGKYEYLCLPMELCNSPDIFQEKMSELMNGLEFARAYLDDLLIISAAGGFTEHLDRLEQVFTRLAESGLKVNASKSSFAKTNLNYLGYLISRDGIKPSLKKVEAIYNIEPPKIRKQLRRFIGMVNYYRDMWPHRSHVLAPLSALTSIKVKWQWTEEHQNAFMQMKTLISKETLLAYPNFNKKFEIHTDASKVQLGACLSQEGRPLAFYSRKLNPVQTRYTTTEREFLSIVETLKEFRNMLLGQQIVVHTDHENLTYKNFNSDRVMHWRLFIEEYSPDLQYIKGTHNVVADALSRLDKSEEPIKNDADMLMTYIECLAKEENSLKLHPLNYQHLQIA